MRASLDHCCTNCTEPCVPMQLHGAASGLLHTSILLASNCSLGQESYWEVWHCFASSFPPSLVKLFPQIREEAASARVFIKKKKKSFLWYVLSIHKLDIYFVTGCAVNSKHKCRAYNRTCLSNQ